MIDFRMSKSIANINNFIQHQLKAKKKKEVSLRTAANWLDQSGHLCDSHSSPGFPLRRLIASKNIVGAYKKNNYFWYIKQADDYRELIAPNELHKLLGYKNINSFYRKIKTKNIPHFRLENKQILFYKDEIIPWLISNQHYDSVDNLERMIFHDTKFLIKEVRTQI
jgi:hypothetical protein